jgi:beta-lactamase superfamily II metal-dependent hydrolase
MTRLFGSRAAALLLLPIAAGCGADRGTAPPPTAPVITISGVQPGGSYQVPVTINISVDRGSYEARLNGQPFITGTTVSQPGAYTLSVAARAGTETANAEVAFSIAAPSGGILIIRVFDLACRGDFCGGGGDAILLTDSSAAGQVHAVIDAGPGGLDASDAARFARWLAAQRVDTLSFMLLTHAHGDHYQGMLPVFDAVRVRRFYYSGQVRNLTTYTSLLNQARARADSVIIVRDTIPLAFGRSSAPTRITHIPPLPTWVNTHTNDGAELNEGSVGTYLSQGTFRMFFTGDGEYLANQRWRTQFAAYTRNVNGLKVGHHGANNAIFDSGTSGPSTWLDHTAPQFTVISANGLSHPRVRALTRILERTNRSTYCTHVHGTIEIRVFSDSRFLVIPERNAGSDCVPGSQADT